MKRLVGALLALLAGCAGVPVAGPTCCGVGTPPAVVTARQHTLFAEDLSCTAVDIGGGTVLTARHCVEGELMSTAQGTVVFVGPHRDFAILHDPTREANPYVCMRAPEFGEHVYVVGYPAQLISDMQELTVTDGIVAGPKIPEDSDVAPGALRHTAPTYGGNSGGGVWGNDGCLVGIHVASVRAQPGAAYMTSVSDIKPFLPR